MFNATPLEKYRQRSPLFSRTCVIWMTIAPNSKNVIMKKLFMASKECRASFNRTFWLIARFSCLACCGHSIFTNVVLYVKYYAVFLYIALRLQQIKVWEMNLRFFSFCKLSSGCLITFERLTSRTFQVIRSDFGLVLLLRVVANSADILFR